MADPEGKADRFDRGYGPCHGVTKAGTPCKLKADVTGYCRRHTSAEPPPDPEIPETPRTKQALALILARKIAEVSAQRCSSGQLAALANMSKVIRDLLPDEKDGRDVEEMTDEELEARAREIESQAASNAARATSAS